MSPTPEAAKPGNDNGLVVGATRLGWLYGKGRKWGARLLRSWAEEQARGGPIRVFIGVGGALFTTMPVVHQYMPPGRDIVLYRRVEVLEVDVADLTRRVDQDATRLSDIERRLARFGDRKAG